MGDSGRDQLAGFQKLHRVNYYGKFTTANDLAPSPVDLETGFYQNNMDLSVIGGSH